MRVEGTTDKMMDFLKKNGINLSELSRIAGIPYKLLYTQGVEDLLRCIRRGE